MMHVQTPGKAFSGRLLFAILDAEPVAGVFLVRVRGEPTPPPLPPTVGGVSPRVAWSASIGQSGVGFQPAVVGSSVFAAAADGTVVRL
jgi:hypothetical protein